MYAINFILQYTPCSCARLITQDCNEVLQISAMRGHTGVANKLLLKANINVEATDQVRGYLNASIDTFSVSYAQSLVSQSHFFEIRVLTLLFSSCLYVYIKGWPYTPHQSFTGR